MVKEYPKRFLLCFFNIALCGLACALGVMAGEVGTHAWGTLALGIGNRTGLSFGTASLVVSVVIVVIDLLGRGKLGFGSLINVIFVAYFSDFFLAVLDFMPPADNLITGLLYTLSGQVLLSFATIWYMKPALGCGPRDTLMVLIGKKLPKVPIGLAKFVLEATVLVVGVFLGAPFGLGTVLIVALQASIFQLACRVTGVEPRSIPHEDFAETCRNLTAKTKK